VAGDLTYVNSPNFTSRRGDEPAQRDAWVTQNATKDLVAYAVRGSIFWRGREPTPIGLAGVTTIRGRVWLTLVMNLTLAQTVSRELRIDNSAFRHVDGTMSAWYDATATDM